MLQEGKVDKLTIVNKEKVFIYIKKEYLSEEQFKNVSKTPIGNSQNLGPHYFFEIGSVESFNLDLKEKPWKTEGEFTGEWILIDYSEIIVHVFQKETREFYKLEELWGDAKSKKYN